MSILNYRLRSATKQDDQAIKDLIHGVHINPLGIHWERFVIAETMDKEFIGCGQIKHHFDGSHELASLAIEEKYRKHGMASAIIEKLLENTHRPLYLMCRPELGLFYEKFGFSAIKISDYPPYFQRIHRIMRLMVFMIKGKEPLIMRLDK